MYFFINDNEHELNKIICNANNYKYKSLLGEFGTLVWPVQSHASVEQP